MATSTANAPGSNLGIAHYAIELSGSLDEDDDSTESLIPRFLGHDMMWWAVLGRQQILDHRNDPIMRNNLLSRLGILDAVQAWIRAERAWEKWRAAARRKATKQGRNWLGEMIPKVL